MIRSFLDTDLPALHQINQESAPGVSSETQESLSNWINLSTVFVASDAKNQPIGFITLVETGTKAYSSPNLRWFETWQEEQAQDVVYVDRIAISKTARGQGLGEKLYQAAFEAFAGRGLIGCEVNTLPDNPGSHRFHKRLGFYEVGRQVLDPGRKAVAYYVRTLG